MIRALPPVASRCFCYEMEPSRFLIASGSGRWLRDSRNLQGLRSNRRQFARRPSPNRPLLCGHADLPSRRARAAHCALRKRLCPSHDSGTTVTGPCLRACNPRAFELTFTRSRSSFHRPSGPCLLAVPLPPRPDASSFSDAPGSAQPSFLSAGPDGSRLRQPRADRYLHARALEPSDQLSTALANLLMNQSAFLASSSSLPPVHVARAPSSSASTPACFCWGRRLSALRWAD